jgi:diacylglycerol kinase (ATP)
MRVAAILGPGASPQDLRTFQENSGATWLTGVPRSAGEADAVLIFGGDGTVHRYLRDLVRLRLPVLVVPCGSGNDFARALGLRKVRDSLAAWRRFLADGGNVGAIDLGLVTALAGLDGGGAPTPCGYYFSTVAGIGLDSEVARRANRLPRWLRGNGGYALALLPALINYTPVWAQITVPVGQRAQAAPGRGVPIFLAAFANARAYGGGMMIAPRARLDDGQLDVCVIHDMDKSKLFCLFPSVYFGHHLHLAEVEYFQTESLELKTEAPLEVYADGEYLCRTPIAVGVVPGALRIIAQAGANHGLIPAPKP